MVNNDRGTQLPLENRLDVVPAETLDAICNVKATSSYDSATEGPRIDVELENGVLVALGIQVNYEDPEHGALTDLPYHITATLKKESDGKPVTIEPISKDNKTPIFVYELTSIRPAQVFPEEIEVVLRGSRCILYGFKTKPAMEINDGTSAYRMMVSVPVADSKRTLVSVLSPSATRDDKYYLVKATKTDKTDALGIPVYKETYFKEIHVM